MTKEQIGLINAVNLLASELTRAEGKFPSFPTDPIHAVAIMEEESGEAMRAALQLVYEGGSMEALRKEIIQTGAMALRCLINMHNFVPVRSMEVEP